MDILYSEVKLIFKYGILYNRFNMTLLILTIYLLINKKPINILIYRYKKNSKFSNYSKFKHYNQYKFRDYTKMLTIYNTIDYLERNEYLFVNIQKGI